MCTQCLQLKILEVVYAGTGKIDESSVSLDVYRAS